MYSKSPCPTSTKGSRGSFCCMAIGPVSAGIQIHGLTLSCKGRKTFAWCALQAETGAFIFLFLALQRPSQQREVPRLHPQHTGDAAGASPVLGDSAPEAWRLGPRFKTALIGLRLHQKQPGSIWLFSVPLAPSVQLTLVFRNGFLQ